MDFPSGHHRHHRHPPPDDEEHPPFYPPPDGAPPPPPFFRNEFPPPPPPHFDHPPPPPPPVTEFPDEEVEIETRKHRSFQPHMPSFVHHTSHHSTSSPGLDLSDKPTYKVYSKADPNFHLTIRDGQVVLAPSDPSDAFQNWYKDEKYSTKVKDEEGYPGFSLVNKASGQAIKHSIGASHPVQLIAYNPEVLDESVLWSESKDLGDGYRAVRMVNNVRLNFDAFHADHKSGGVHDGTTVVLSQWNKGNNQRWRITPHCKPIFTSTYYVLIQYD